MAKVHVTRTPCTLADGRTRLEGSEHIRWLVWDHGVEDGRRDEDGRLCVGIVRPDGMHATFAEAIAYATTIENGD